MPGADKPKMHKPEPAKHCSKIVCSRKPKPAASPLSADRQATPSERGGFQTPLPFGEGVGLLGG